MKYLVALLFFLSGAALADSLVHKSEDFGKIVIDLSKACSPKVAALIEEPKNYRAAKLTYQGKDYVGCGADLGEVVCVVVPDVGHVDLPKDMFTKLTNVKK